MYGNFGQFVESLIAKYGCGALFGILLVCGLGLPLPEDVPLIFTGIFIFRGQMNWAQASVAAWCGIIGGDTILYMLGRRFGRDISRVPFVGRHIDVHRIDRMERWFKQYGIWVVAVGRMFAGVRAVMVVVAGATRFKYWKFVIADGLAAIVSGGLFIFLGYKFAEHLDTLKAIIHNIKGGMLIALVASIAAVLLYIWRRKRRNAKDAFPIIPDKPNAPNETEVSASRRADEG